ncbi:hypothetical protein GUITHDRAFT_101153 [Guillardia theta CCMP2712]|uniref:Methyltransferase domain-containing protein n=1 Tax=Guillardia theta (strain CCMP2712) TaxID=905079 RepID=L1JYK7_GUITC|nr:hypothetical protein GUITHDRAFT_101153 [Guillardia theta CCMP2712]EKX53452.1 hypothetical protein GUITHDRAFT_101153 [Guillardia theta CCMP2712]|eukprot:XP_005840432.1 hypothetical protein GUITHDRAFT_101153 [Guillardia theta CCMP2712]
MVVIGGYDDSMKRLGVQSWQVGEGFAPTYHFDMLQDRRRNEAYRRGIEQTVEEDDLVVDIGTGSGLLAMMAAGAGAQHVFAIEGDPKLEKAARLVIEDNRYEEKVTVIGKHSTEVKVGYGLDVPFGANVIVTEIFDSFMLGEGMVPTMHDAVKRGLLAEGGRVIPAGGRMHCVLIESDWIRRHETLRGQDLLGSVEEVKRASVEHAREAVRPLKVMEDGTVDAILIWWTLDMEGTGAVQLSTEPEGYGRGGFEDERDGYPPPEREHWRQAACVLPAAVEVVKGDLLQVVCGHKECYPRFMVRKSYDDATKDLEGEFLPFEAPSKDCVQYPFLRRCHILQLSCQERENSYISVVCDLINKSLDKGDPSQDTLKVLLLGDGPLLPIAAAKAITDLRQEESERRMRISVVSLQSSLDACELANMAVKGRNQEGAIKVVAVVEKGQTFDGSMTEAVCSAASRELQGGRFDVVLAEPSYHALAVGGAGGTWAVDEFLRFWQEITALRDNVGILCICCFTFPAALL